MIHVEYEKEDNYPHDRELILFDRNAFQGLPKDVIPEINKKYNILCPRIFVMECIAPNNTDKKPAEELEKNKKSLLEKLKLIENPIVLTGPINISYIIGTPLNVYFFTLLTSEQIAGNCIAGIPITMKRIEPDELISHYKPEIDSFKYDISSITERCDAGRGTLTSKQINLAVQQIVQVILNRPVSTQEVKDVLKQDKQTYVSQTLSYCAERTLREIESKTMGQQIEMFEKVLDITGKNANALCSEIIGSKRLTMENYPHLAYPIYIYYLFNFVTYARQINAEHLDRSYWRDFRYLHYLNFCDMFIANEKSTPHIVNSIPYDDIRKTPVITADELRRKLN